VPQRYQLLSSGYVRRSRRQSWFCALGCQGEIEDAQGSRVAGGQPPPACVAAPTSPTAQQHGPLLREQVRKLLSALKGIDDAAGKPALYSSSVAVGLEC
jgi:hypothetical protein